MPRPRLECPKCDYRFTVHRDDVDLRRVRCPDCDAWVENSEEGPPRRSKPRPKKSSNNWLVYGLVGAALLLVTCCGGPVAWWLWASQTTTFPEQTEDYADARKTFKTTLETHGPAPQDGEIEEPPRGVKAVPYTSDGLALVAWVNVPPPGSPLKPAIVYCHGGFAFGEEDWDQTKIFRDAGFVVMTPILRGENGQSGDFTLFYDEVNDVVAATEVLAKIPGVDPNRIYVCGHSAGGTLAMLAAMTSKRYKAAAAFSGSPDHPLFCRFAPGLATYDSSNDKELEMRSPLAYPKSIKCPMRLYFGGDEIPHGFGNTELAQKATAAGLDVKAVEIPGDHFSMLDPAMKQALAFFQQK